MTKASRPLRLVEIILWILGITLLSTSSEATLDRWNYQKQQERALFQRGPAVPVQTEVRETTVAPDRAEVTSPEPVARVVQKRRASSADPSALGRIEIPRLGIAAIVKEGADEGTLTRAVGHVPRTARPGELGNVVLAGHRDTFFRPLRKIKVNDRIRLIVPPHTYEYRVQSLRVVAPEETSVLDSNGVEELTLVTCYPFRFVGPAPERFIVNAARVN